MEGLGRAGNALDFKLFVVALATASVSRLSGLMPLTRLPPPPTKAMGLPSHLIPVPVPFLACLPIAFPWPLEHGLGPTEVRAHHLGLSLWPALAGVWIGAD